MTRNQIFGAGVAAIVAFMTIGSLFSDEDRSYRHDDRDDWRMDVDIDVDGDEIIIKSVGGKTVVYTENGKVECSEGQDAITITRKDGSETRIAC
ncbi:MAG: hypothetical protein JJ850_14080 [Kordiimonadaceae bacterium]|nr:hypothetical protein [Kordiimonadaceae bacterium]MBO6570158.1 hypothetical protein [Kordiimonadaceae bacterium]MBO6965744.1 hypothetical protein [Kordiimonadaceae bacterium]